MADQYLQQLTSETAPAATDVVPISDNGTQRLRSLEYSYVGLEDTTGSDADVTMAAGKLYVVAMSGWATADRTYTLPAAASIATGQRIGIMVSSGNASYELLIKSGAAGDLINGTDHSSTEWSRLFISGEVVILRCIDGSTGDWIVEHDGRIPCATIMHRNGTNQTITDAAWDQIEYTNTSLNTGSMGDTTNFEVHCRRAGNYAVDAWVASVASMADQKPITHKITSDAAAADLLYSQMYTSVATSNNLSNTLSGLLKRSAGDKLEHWCYIDFVSTATIDGRAQVTGFSVVEVI